MPDGHLGNIIVQIPVTIIIASFAQSRHNSNATVTVLWHPQASSRDLVATCEKVYDNVVTGYAATPVKSPEVALLVEDGLGMQRGILWDEAKQLMLAATEPTAFINQIGMQTHLSDPEPRVFTLMASDGTAREVRVGLTDVSNNTVQAPHVDRGEEWTRRRVYREEANRLSAQRRFVQYRPDPGQQQASHDKALNDLVLLLRQHGRGGAWLWDPYLSADDLLRTLFQCPFKYAPLRALTAAYEPPITSRPKPTLRSIIRQIREWCRDCIGRAPPALSFAERQRGLLNFCRSNYRGLNIEYRMKAGQAGWAFHDRFLIFPNTDNGPLDWSLGSSVNSLGRQHHILQHVDDARLVADAFEELWDELSEPEHLVWKMP